MNRLLFLLLLFLSPKNDVEKIVVKKVDFGMESIINISCNRFEYQLSQMGMKTYTYTSQDTIDKIMYNIDHSKKIELPNGIDVRGKMYIFHNSGVIDTLCLTNFNVYELNGVPMQFPDYSLELWLRYLGR